MCVMLNENDGWTAWDRVSRVVSLFSVLVNRAGDFILKIDCLKIDSLI